VTLDSYGTIIDELMLRSVKDLKSKLTTKKEGEDNSYEKRLSNAHHELILNMNKTNQN